MALSPELSDPFLSDFGGRSMGSQAASAWDGNRLRQAYMGTRSGGLQTWLATLKLR